MNTFDLVVIIIFLVFGFGGWKNGLVKKIISFATLVASIIIAAKFSSSLGASLFSSLDTMSEVKTGLAFLLIVISITVLQSIIYKIFIHKMIAGTWNQIAGATLALLEGALFASILILLLDLFFQVPSQKSRDTSTFYHPVKEFAPMVFDKINIVFPESGDFYESIMGKIRLKDSLSPKGK